MSNLRTRVEHFYGSQEKRSIELVKLRLVTDGLDEKEALENGWLYYKNEWYPCRSTRLEIARWKPKPEDLPDCCQVSLIEEPTPRLKQVYQDFLKIKGFKNLNNPFGDKDRQQYLVITDAGTLVAFTRFNHYNGGIESQYTAWNYHNPKLSIGRKIISYEVAYARSLGFDYLYIGEGYEVSSSYKASLHGFQWWTGGEWSTDQQMYRDLCARDSKVRSIRDLAALFQAD
jgi:hypothetical protein